MTKTALSVGLSLFFPKLLKDGLHEETQAPGVSLLI